MVKSLSIVALLIISVVALMFDKVQGAARCVRQADSTETAIVINVRLVLSAAIKIPNLDASAQNSLTTLNSAVSSATNPVGLRFRSYLATTSSVTTGTVNKVRDQVQQILTNKLQNPADDVDEQLKTLLTAVIIILEQQNDAITVEIFREQVNRALQNVTVALSETANKPANLLNSAVKMRLQLQERELKQIFKDLNTVTAQNSRTVLSNVQQRLTNLINGLQQAAQLGVQNLLTTINLILGISTATSSVSLSINISLG